MSILDAVQSRLDERNGVNGTRLNIIDSVNNKLKARRNIPPVNNVSQQSVNKKQPQIMKPRLFEFGSFTPEIPQEEKTFGQKAFDVFKPAITALSAPVTIPANVIIGLIKDFTGGSSQKNVDAIRRIAALNTQEGDEVYVADVLKTFGVTDEKLKLPEGTIDRTGFIGDMIAFGGIDKFVKGLAKVSASANPVKTFRSQIDDVVGRETFPDKKAAFITNAPEKPTALLPKPKIKSKRLKSLATKNIVKAKDKNLIDVVGIPRESSAIKKGSIISRVDDILNSREQIKPVFAKQSQGVSAFEIAKQGTPIKDFKVDVVRVPRTLKPTPATQSLFTPLQKEAILRRIAGAKGEKGFIKNKIVTDSDFMRALKSETNTMGDIPSLSTTIKKKLASEAGFARFAKDKVVEQRFRTDKFNVSAVQENQLIAMQEALGLKVRTVQTFGDMSDLAIDLGMDVERLLKTTSNPKNFISAAQVKALGNTIKTNMEFVSKTAKKIKEIQTFNPVEAESLQLQIDKSLKLTQQAIKNRIKGGTEAGRTVVAFRLMAENTLDPSFWITRAQRIANKPFTTEQLGKVIETINEISKNGTPQDMAAFVATLRDVSLLDKFVVLWKTGLLTSPLTHAANMSGNLSMAALETASDIPATGLDMLVSMARMGIGKGAYRTVTITPKTVWAKIRAFKRGGQKAMEFFKTGNYPKEILIKYDVPKNIHFKNKYLDAYVQSVMRSLGAEDILFREIAMVESFEKQAILIAKNEIFKNIITKNRFKSRVAELLKTPTNQMISKAIDTAEKATYQGPNPLSRAFSGGRKTAEQFGATGEIFSAATHVVVPFSTTPTNIAERIFSFSPGGFMKPIFRLYKPSNITQEMVVKDLGRAITGTGIISGGYYLASKGLVTGNAPSNPRAKAQSYAEGKKFNSMLINNKWRQLNRISPLGNLITLGAEFYRLQNEGLKGTELAKATAFGALKTLTEQTFLRGVSSAIKALDDPEKGLEPYLNMLAGSIVPSIIARTAKTIDPFSRMPENQVEAIGSRLPFLSRRYAIRRDSLGNAVKVPGERTNIIDPFSSSKTINNPVLIEARRIGSPIGLPSNTISGTKMTRMEYSSYQKTQGMVLEQVLENIISTEEYQNSSTAEKANIFARATRKVRTEINNTIFPALMFKRYNLPQDTNVSLLREVLSQLNKQTSFKKSNILGQEKRIKAVLSKIKKGNKG